MFLLAFILLPLLSGCGDGGMGDPVGLVDIESEKSRPREVIVPTSEVGAVSKSEIKDIGFFDNPRWIVVSRPLEIEIYSETATKLASLIGYEGIVETIALSATGENLFIAAGCSDGIIRSWYATDLRRDIEGKEPEHLLIYDESNKDYYQNINTNQTGGVKVLAASLTDSKLLVADEGDIGLWEIGAEAPPLNRSHNFDAHSNKVTTLTFSHDGRFFASGSVDAEVRVWDYKDRIVKRIFNRRENEVTALVFLPHGKFLGIESTLIAGGGKDSQIMLWDIEKEEAGETEPVDVLSFGEEEKADREVTALGFLKNRNLLISGTNQGEIYFWDMNVPNPADKRSEPLKKHKSPITALASSAKGDILVSGSADGVVHVSTGQKFPCCLNDKRTLRHLLLAYSVFPGCMLKGIRSCKKSVRSFLTNAVPKRVWHFHSADELGRTLGIPYRTHGETDFGTVRHELLPFRRSGGRKDYSNRQGIWRQNRLQTPIHRRREGDGFSERYNTVHESTRLS